MAGESSIRYNKKLAFRTARPVADAALLIRFGRDLYKESVGREDAFYRDYGRYGASFPLWIANCLSRDPSFAALLTEDGREIGLIVIGMDERDETLGRVHQLYVTPSHRGQGFGGLLDDYARDILSALGARRARLNVAVGNARAIRFYKALGWEEMTRRGGLLWLETRL
ncbi:MAG: GNAT family N-acetyltransferase [Pseudomonadota bacterium]